MDEHRIAAFLHVAEFQAGKVAGVVSSVWSQMFRSASPRLDFESSVQCLDELFDGAWKKDERGRPLLQPDVSAQFLDALGEQLFPILSAYQTGLRSCPAGRRKRIYVKLKGLLGCK